MFQRMNAMTQGIANMPSGASDIAAHHGDRPNRFRTMANGISPVTMLRRNNGTN